MVDQNTGGVSLPDDLLGRLKVCPPDAKAIWFRVVAMKTIRSDRGFKRNEDMVRTRRLVCNHAEMTDQLPVVLAWVAIRWRMLFPKEGSESYTGAAHWFLNHRISRFQEVLVQDRRCRCVDPRREVV